MSVGTRAQALGAGVASLRFRGRLAELTEEDRRALFERSTSTDDAIPERTARVIARVRREGDDALRAMAREFDGVALEAIEVPRARWDAALEALDPALRRAIERSIANVDAVHRAFMPQTREASPEPGVDIGRRPDPLGRVGVYAPGGRAAYPSSVIMGVVPARVAGVGEVILCSPPQRDTGLPSAVVLAAAALTGVDRVFALGGAGAVAAMAYGTASVPRVDRIVGPGNAYVAEAKLQVSGATAIDSPAGPSELLVVAGVGADPALVARELVAQAEHDPLAADVAVVVGEALARLVEAELVRQAATAERAAIVRDALAGQGGVLWCDRLDEAVRFASAYAPEHLLLAIPDQGALDGALAMVRNAGTVFVGETASVAFGDYMTGANHVLPTGGLARSYSGLSTLDFVRWTTWQRVDRAAAAALAGDVGTFAEAEGLPGHAQAARAWGSIETSARSEGSRRPTTDSRQPESLARSAVRTLPRYQPDEGECEIDVSDNTNLWGTPPAAQRAIFEGMRAVSRYPSLYAGSLARRLLAYVALEPERAGVVTGCGSDDVLDAAMRAFGEPGDAIAFSAPTFSMIPTFARLNGLEPRAVPLRDDWEVDPDRLLATGAKILYLCAPNNPTATGVSRTVVERVLERAPGLVIVDEAYAEFAPASVVDLVARHERLLVTRTMSKAFGLAGLRVGYGVASPALASLVERARGPYKVSALAERAAAAALTEGEEGLGWVRRHAALAVETRERLTTELRALGLEPAPSAANFVFVPVAGAPALGARLRARGILVRTHAGLPTDLPALAASGGEALRIGVGPWETMVRVLDALRAELGR